MKRAILCTIKVSWIQIEVPIPKMKIVKNSPLVLLYCTFTMYWPGYTA